MAASGVESSRAAGTPAILLSEEEEGNPAKSGSKVSSSHREKKSSGGKKEKKDKKEKRDKKDKDKQREPRKGRHPSKEDDATASKTAAETDAADLPDASKAVQSEQDGGVSEAIAAAAAKAAELAAVAGLNNEHSNGKRETEGRHSEGQRSPGQRRRREEQPGAHEGTRKRRRRSSRSRSRSPRSDSKVTQEQSARETEQAKDGDQDGEGDRGRRLSKESQAKPEAGRDERMHRQSSHADNAERGKDVDRQRERDKPHHRQDTSRDRHGDRESDTSRSRHRDKEREVERHKDRDREREGDRERERAKEKDRERDRETERERERDRETERERARDRDRERDRERHRRDREDRETHERASNRDRSRDEQSRGEARLGRDRHRREETVDPRRDRYPPIRDNRRGPRREGLRSRSRDRTAEDSSRMPPPETPPSRGRQENNRLTFSSPRARADDSANLASPRSTQSAEGGAATALDPRAAKLFEEEAEAERRRALREAANFEGCYPALVTTLLHLLPQKVAVQGSRILARLKVYEATARFQVVAEDAVRGHAEGTDPALRQVHMACGLAGKALSRLAHALLSCPSQMHAPRPSIIAAFSPEGLQLDKSFEMDAWVEEALVSRCCLPLLAALLHVPKLQALHQKQAGSLLPGQTPDHIQLQLAQPLHAGLSQFLSVLISCSTGVAILSRRLPVAMAIMEALQPGMAQQPFLAQPNMQAKSSGAEIAQSLKAHLAASQALQQLPQLVGKQPGKAEPQQSQEAARLLEALLEATAVDMGKRGVISAMLSTPGAFQAILSLIKDPVARIEDPEMEGDAKPLALWKASCIYAIRLLALCTSEGCPQVLKAWAGYSDDIKAAVATVMNLPEVQQPGADKAKRDLKALKGRSEMVSLLTKKGLADVINSLHNVLPPLVRPEGQKKGLKQVDVKACSALVHNPEKAAQTETGLDLLQALLKGTLKAHACVQISHSFGLEVLERAVRCGTEVLAASKADAEWVATAGDAVDIAEMLANRERAVSLLAASLSALALMLQQLRLNGSDLNSATLMRSIMQAYFLLATAPESFCAVAGQMGSQPRHPLLQARQAAASALRSWVDADNWTPDLVTAIFTGGHPLPADGPLVMLLSPAEMLEATCLLGDLFPAEWPPQSSAARMGMSHPPPSQMEYRRAIASRFETAANAFKRLIEFSATSTSRLIRASLVRLCTKASGLGGGVGTFLAGLLMTELESCATTDSSFRDVRRMLEILVPLMYRPAMKAAFLDQGIVTAIAKLLTHLMRDETHGPEVTSLCTMALEIVTVLFNPDVCLNPLLPVTQRVIDDCPSVKEAASLIAVLLPTLTQMAGNAHIGKRVIAGMAAHPSGRASLRLGCMKWQARETGMHDPQGANSSAQWAVTRLWQLGQEEGSEAGMREICMDIANHLEAVASSGEDFEEDAAERVPAPQRFMTAVQAAVQTAEALGMTPVDESPSPEALIHDPVTRMFWKNVKARTTNQASSPTTVTINVPAGHVELPAGNIREGLTKAKRARDSTSEAMSGIVSAMPDVKKGREEVTAVKALAGVGPQADLPPVLAGPGRPKGRSFGRGGGSTGRPASMHVDDYESKAAAAVGNQPPSSGRTPNPPVPPPRPPPGGPKPAPPKGTPPSAANNSSLTKVSPQKSGAHPKYPSKPIRPFGAPKPSSDNPTPAPPAPVQLSTPSPGFGMAPASAAAAGQGGLTTSSPSGQGTNPKPSPVASSPSDANMANLMKSPAAIAELLKDPARLQQLLEQNPALMSVLQAKMQKS